MSAQRVRDMRTFFQYATVADFCEAGRAPDRPPRAVIPERDQHARSPGWRWRPSCCIRRATTALPGSTSAATEHRARPFHGSLAGWRRRRRVVLPAPPRVGVTRLRRSRSARPGCAHDLADPPRAPAPPAARRPPTAPRSPSRRGCAPPTWRRCGCGPREETLLRVIAGKLLVTGHGRDARARAGRGGRCSPRGSRTGSPARTARPGSSRRLPVSRGGEAPRAVRRGGERGR